MNVSGNQRILLNVLIAELREAWNLLKAEREQTLNLYLTEKGLLEGGWRSLRSEEDRFRNDKERIRAELQTERDALQRERDELRRARRCLEDEREDLRNERERSENCWRKANNW